MTEEKYTEEELTVDTAAVETPEAENVELSDSVSESAAVAVEKKDNFLTRGIKYAAKNFDSWKAWIYLLPAIILLLIFTVWPIINTVRIAFLEGYRSVEVANENFYLKYTPKRYHLCQCLFSC